MSRPSGRTHAVGYAGPLRPLSITNGQTLTFGEISLSSETITAGGRTVAWNRIEQIRLKEGVLSIKMERKWFALTRELASQIPNFFVCYALTTQLHAQAR